MGTIEQFWLFHCGYFNTRRGLWLEGGGFEKIRLPLMAALLVHSELGPILIDAPFGAEGPANAGEFFGAIARRSGLVFKDEWAIIPRIEQLGFRASEINHVLMTHLHFDHTGGMKSIAHAQFHIDRDEWMHSTGLKPLEATRAGYAVGDFRALAPRVEKLDLCNATLDAGHDVFGDGSIEAIPLHGHSIGHTGYRCKLHDRTVFFVGDAVYFEEQITTDKGISLMGRSAAYDRAEALTTAVDLRAWFGRHPDTIFANSHDVSLGESCMGGPRALHGE